MSDIVERLRKPPFEMWETTERKVCEDAAAEIDRLRDGLTAAIRAAKLALFVINKAGVMPNSSWESGFKSDFDKATAAITTSQRGTE